MRRVRWQLLLGGALLIQGAVVAGGAETDLPAAPGVVQAGFPLPPGVVALPEPTKVDLGTTSLDVHTILTDLNDQELVEFYEEALPKSGFRLSLLPWQAHHAMVAARLEKTLQDHRNAPEAPELKALQEEFKRTQQEMRRQLYASRGREHVIVNLWRIGGGTAVFINRWNGDRSWMEGGRRPVRSLPGSSGREPLASGSDAPSAQGESWLKTNVCCSGEQVPALTASLPLSVPRYPGARAVARSTSRGGVSTTLLLMANDSVQAVSAYYRKEMPVQGWRLLGEEEEIPEPGVVAYRLSFQKPDRLCLLTIQGVLTTHLPAPQSEASRQAGPSSETMITLAITPRSGGEGAP